MDYMWKVDLKSRDNNQYAFMTIAKTSEEAEEKAHNEIRKNGWGHYCYVTKEVKNLGEI